jgi:RecA-family ATPase
VKVFDRIDGALESPSLLKAALSWAELGVPVLLCWGVDDRGRCDCGRKKCATPGKHPIAELFSHGHKSASTNTTVIRRAVRRHPNANLAIVPMGDLLVLDVDGEIGKKTFMALGLPATATVLTARGMHAYYRKIGPLPLRTPKLDGIDVKTGGAGYILVPPSIHASGHEYCWEDRHRGLAKIRLEQLCAAPPPTTVERRANLLAVEGSRNSTLTSFAGYFRSRGLGDKQIRRMVDRVNEVICNPPLEDTEVAGICRSIAKYSTDHEKAFGNLDEVEERDLEWLAYPYFVRGAVNIIEGNPGDGKSTFVVALASAVTKGARLPFVDDLASGSVLVLSAEDDPARILKPRFSAHGADLRRVRFQQEAFTLDHNGLALLRWEIATHHPTLVIIDPIIAYMDASLDMHRANPTMQFMNSLDQLARQFDTTVLIVRHLRKSESNDALYRGLGSIAISARVRSILILGRHPEDREVRVLAHAKSNYAPFGPSILFDLRAEQPGRPPKTQWLGTTEKIRAEDILSVPARDRGRPDDERGEAKTLLRNLLQNGPKSKQEVLSTAERYSISEMTLRRAAADLGVRKSRKAKKSFWSLP